MSTKQHEERVESILFSLLNASIGRDFKRITSSDNPDSSRRFYAIKAIGGSATVGSGTETDSEGDSPEGDPIQEGDVMFGDFTTVDITSGTAYAYYRT